jgi:putative SOS response-associated peptidase YedK
MCSHYQPVTKPEILQSHFGVRAPVQMGRPDMWPGYEGVFIRRPELADVGDDAVPHREAKVGRWGLIPHWAKDDKVRNTFNARSESIGTKPSFRDAWRKGQRCIIPAMAVYEPDWRSGKAQPARISLVDEQPMGIAGLWSSWKSSQGWVESYTMLTLNADGHDLMQHLHRPEEEKRMVAILRPEEFECWLAGASCEAADLIYRYPAEELLM